MIKFLSFIAYIFIFIPIWGVRKLTGSGRFGSRFHKSRTAWNQPFNAGAEERKAAPNEMGDKTSIKTGPAAAQG